MSNERPSLCFLKCYWLKPFSYSSVYIDRVNNCYRPVATLKFLKSGLFFVALMVCLSVSNRTSEGGSFYSL